MQGAPAPPSKELGSHFPTLWQLLCMLWFLCFPAGPEVLALCCLLANWEMFSPSLRAELRGKGRVLQHQTDTSGETAGGSEERNYDKEIPLFSYTLKKKRKPKKKGVISAFLHRRAKYGFSYQLHYFLQPYNLELKQTALSSNICFWFQTSRNLISFSPRANVSTSGI